MMTVFGHTPQSASQSLHILMAYTKNILAIQTDPPRNATMRATLLLAVFVSPVMAAEPNALPAAWHGTWAGTLDLPGGKTVPMTLAIAPVAGTNAVTWTITYGDGEKASVRNYQLAPHATTKDRYLLNEKNGITLDVRLHKDTLHSQFEVQGSLLVGRYELRDGKLHYEITSSAKPTETGDGVKVKVYAVTSVQTAVLSKPK
jgi:hypothetical protein